MRIAKRTEQQLAQFAPMVPSKKDLINRATVYLTVQSVMKVHCSPCNPHNMYCWWERCVVHVYIRICVHGYIREVVLFMLISEKLCCSCLYKKLCCSCLYQRSFVFHVYISSCVVVVLSGPSVTVVIDRSRSEGEEVVFINIRCCVWGPGWILL